MMTYEIEISKSAQKELNKIDRSIQPRVAKAIYLLINDQEKVMLDLWLEPRVGD